MSGLTTHILNVTIGQPAENVKVELFAVKGYERILLTTAITNQDGRLDVPLLSEEDIRIGDYELVFHIGDYFRNKGIKLREPPFLDKVPVRFGIADPNSHYHVPLLISPWSYQVYRGS